MSTGETAAHSSERESFERDGFLIFDPGLGADRVDAVVAAIEGEFHAESGASRTLRRARRAVLGKSSTLAYRDERRILDAWTVHQGVREVARAPRVLDLLRDLYGREPKPFQTLNFKRGSEQRPHSDAMHFNSEPAGFMCGVWVALEDIDADNGPLVYYPGSHMLPEATLADVERETGISDASGYEDLVAKIIEREGMQEHIGTMRKGEALLWSSNLIHGGAPQSDPERTRWSQVTHYFFEGVKAWRPVHSNGERHYFEPAWVR
jgi:ectoine hydroxylase-related dioxygenase (phytanoyl-CoA dioxygenase family)